jgi:hypothetical protein
VAGGDRLLRHLPEAAVEGLLVYSSQRAAQQTGALWTGTLVSVLVVGALCCGPARRCLLTLAGCLRTLARPRPALAGLVELGLAEAGLPARTGRPSRTLTTLPADLHERVWLLCPVRLSVEDIAGASDRLRAACHAQQTPMMPGRHATVLVLDVIRRSRPVGAAAAGPPSRGAAPPGTAAGRGPGTGRGTAGLGAGIGAGVGRWRL